MTSAPLGPRRWFQFTLRTLLLLMLLVAAYFGGLATARRHAEKALETERKARADLEDRLRAIEYQLAVAENNALLAKRAQLTAMIEQARLQLELARAKGVNLEFATTQPAP